jgi:impB/mucB/samB family C-terminal domain
VRPTHGAGETTSLGGHRGGRETTFARDLTTADEIEAGVEAMGADVWVWCENARAFGRTVTVKVKFADFHQVTRSRNFPMVIARHELLRQASVELVRTLLPTAKDVRLLGVTVSNFEQGRSVPPISCRCLTLPKRSPRAAHRLACADGAPCRQCRPAASRWPRAKMAGRSLDTSWLGDHRGDRSRVWPRRVAAPVCASLLVSVDRHRGPMWSARFFSSFCWCLASVHGLSGP